MVFQIRKTEREREGEGGAEGEREREMGGREGKGRGRRLELWSEYGHARVGARYIYISRHINFS